MIVASIAASYSFVPDAIVLALLFLAGAIATWRVVSFARRLRGQCWHKWDAFGITATGRVIDHCKKCDRWRVIGADGVGVEYSAQEWAQVTKIRSKPRFTKDGKLDLSQGEKPNG